jgi:16S rRNA (cytosine967-C5)-methyltransferase
LNNANPRWIALQVMLQVLDKGRSLDDVFQGEWFQSLSASARDLGLSREISFGLCRWYFALSALLAQRLQKPLRARDRDIELVLLIGLYQLLVLQTGAHAAVNETVKLTQAQNKKWASGLVNAVLRGVLREQLALDADAHRQACPPWILAKIQHDWGAQTDAILLAQNQRPPMTLRVDTRQCAIDAYLAELVGLGLEADRHPLVDSAIVLNSACDVAQLPGFEEGRVSVQDAAAQLAAPLLPSEPGARVLDACAAPGGKSLHLLQYHEGIELDALDSSAARLQRLRQNLARGGQTARVLVGDAALPQDWSAGVEYDAILADLPCSASGVLRRHPDIKLLRRESDIMPLRAQQARILDALWSVLKPGGKMLYSTCSIFKEENESQVSAFLERQTQAREIPLDGVQWGTARPHGRQILPGSDNMDGFYYALLARCG